MNIAGNNSSRSVEKSGAVAGSVLRGCGVNNQGLRVRVLQDQKKGNVGGITGKFLVLDVGENKHASSLDALLNTVTDAEELLELIRSRHPDCVSAVNANILVLDQGGAPRRAGRTKAPTDPGHERGACRDRVER